VLTKSLEKLLKEKGLAEQDLWRLASCYYTQALKKVANKKEFEAKMNAFFSQYEKKSLDKEFIKNLAALKYCCEGKFCSAPFFEIKIYSE
jgi:hypothetical protein